MGLLASGQASLLPKEAFDKGWRKVAVLIVGILAMGAIGYALVKAGRFELAAGIAVPIAGLVAAYLKINIKEHAKDIEKFLPVITSAIEKFGGEKKEEGTP
ncbi:MAG: hypothetical protein ACYSW7_11930 [Planctomycetota bacterium]|jgi:hypothetical protein